MELILDNVEFQSTLPCGSDNPGRRIYDRRLHFNPRSLAGATIFRHRDAITVFISIHAPLRERPYLVEFFRSISFISIHAPLRERHSYHAQEV